MLVELAVAVGTFAASSGIDPQAAVNRGQWLCSNSSGEELLLIYLAGSVLL